MDINLSGKLYIYFIRSIFESKQKIGYELIININKSDNQLICGLIRLNKLNINKIFIKTDDIKIPLKMYDKHYICNITFGYINNINNIDNKSYLILKELNTIEYDKTRQIVDNKLKIQNYATGKQKTIDQIINILSQ